jgi:rod shape determining protein RodA
MQANWKAQHFLHLDQPLLIGILLLLGTGLVILYSAGGQDLDLMMRQMVRILIGFSFMILLAQIQIQQLKHWIPWLYLLGISLLILVLIIGYASKGSQRWLDLGIFRFQPSELMKLVVPIMVSWYLADKPLPPSYGRLLIAAIIIAVPVVLVVKQPDLGTALLIGSSGLFVLFLAGLRWRLIFTLFMIALLSAPILWFFVLYDYQKERILTLFNPEKNALTSGYHIIQSKIAIGSGGIYGKGWLQSTQSLLEFLPERRTDFIFAVYSEEFGLIGVMVLLLLYFFVLSRGMYIALNAQSTFERLLVGSLILTFFVYLFVNISMVTGLLPVVGVPLPLISYGGTSLVTLMASFGLIMAVHTHRRFLSS